MASRIEVAGLFLAGVIGVLQLVLHDPVVALRRRYDQLLVENGNPVLPAGRRLQLAADTAGASLSAYCRAAILGARLPAQRRGRDLSGVLVALNRVGGNLNQIARTVNRGQGVPADLAEVLAEVRAAVERLADEADE